MNSTAIVERGLPLSQSFIWGLQARFYESLGIDAWLSGVIPSKITTNSFIARINARLIAAYAADIGATELTIVELGAGHGRFGFLCVQHLVEMAEAGLFQVAKWKYVMTDVAERNIGFWQKHEALRPLVERGVLDFARYEAGVDTEIQLRESGETLSASSPAQHLVVIGNYFFDSLPIDAWQTEAGALYDCRPVLSLKPDATCDDKQDAAILEQLELSWDRTAVPASRYAHPQWNELVEHFRKRLGDAAFTLPVGAFETLEVIGRWSQDGYLLLSADKGYTREADLVGRPLPTMVQHGCFSFSVNFCALGRWFEQQGGRAWLPEFRDANLEFAAFCIGSRERPTPLLDRAYREGPGEFSPGDFHQVVRRCERTTPELRNCISLIRLAAHEPQVFHHLRRAIRGQLESTSEGDLAAVRETLERVASRYFHLDDQDVPFAIGLVYQQLGDYSAAVKYFRRSLALFGDDATALYNLAFCLVELDEVAEARECIRRSVELDGEYLDAVELACRLGVETTPATAAG